MDRPSLMGKNILHLICNSTFLKRVPGAKEEQQVFATESVRPMAISKHFSWSCSGLLIWFEAPSAPIRYREQLSQPKVRGMGLDDDPVSLTKWKETKGRENVGEAWRMKTQKPRAMADLEQEPNNFWKDTVPDGQGKSEHSVSVKYHEDVVIVFTKGKGPYWLETHASELGMSSQDVWNLLEIHRGHRWYSSPSKVLLPLARGHGPAALTGHSIPSTHICLKLSIIGLGVFVWYFVFSRKQVNQRSKELSQILLYFSLGYFLPNHNYLHPSTLKIIWNA